MNGLDIALILIATVFTAIGAWRGFVRELLALVTWVLAIAIAWVFADDLASLFSRLSDEPSVRQVLAFFVLFVAAFLAGTVAAVLINKFILRQEAVRVPNMLLGGVLGAARGGFILVILFMLAGLTAVPRASWWQESLLAPYVQRAAIFASDYIPRDVARHIRYG